MRDECNGMKTTYNWSPRNSYRTKHTVRLKKDMERQIGLSTFEAKDKRDDNLAIIKYYMVKCFNSVRKTIYMVIP
jgi:hypothetical protein